MHLSDRRRFRVALPAALAALAVTALLVAAERPPTLRLPPDLIYSRAEGSPGPVVFSHVTHVAIADNKCTGCHPEPFRMLRPLRQAAHKEMNAGRLCGTCHDGKTATGTEDDCEHCHKPPAADAAAAGAGSKGGGS